MNDTSMNRFIPGLKHMRHVKAGCAPVWAQRMGRPYNLLSLQIFLL
jgi:hypothetical protein